MSQSHGVKEEEYRFQPEWIRSDIIRLVRLLLVGNNLLNTYGSLDGNHNTVRATIPSITNFVSQSIGVGRKVQVGFLVTTFVHKGELVTFNVDNLPVRLVHNRDGGTVGGGNHIFVLLSSKDISGDKVTLRVTVLSSLGDRYRKDLARVPLDHHVSTENSGKRNKDRENPEFEGPWTGIDTESMMIIVS